jgi:hypothetical protein
MTHFEIIWLFLTGSFLGYILLFFLIVGSFLLLTLIFQAACALANVEPSPSFLYSMLLVFLTLIFTVPLNGFLAYVLMTSLLREMLGAAVVIGFLFVIGFIFCVLICAVMYMLLLRISILKGFLTGLFEQLLALLAFSLLYAILLVILAIIQLRYGPITPPNSSALTPPAGQTVVVAESS